MGCDAGTNNKKKQTATGVWPKTEFGFSLLNSSLLQNSEKKKKEKMESARELRHRDRVMKKKKMLSVTGFARRCFCLHLREQLI